MPGLDPSQLASPSGSQAAGRWGQADDVAQQYMDTNILLGWSSWSSSLKKSAQADGQALPAEWVDGSFSKCCAASGFALVLPLESLRKSVEKLIFRCCAAATRSFARPPHGRVKPRLWRASL